MTFTIIWADSAEIELDKIFEYYSENASRQIAINILQKIISESDKLLIDPETYPLEEALLDRDIQYHYFVCNNYKIIYSIDKTAQLIKIADVFDTRRNPFKIKRTK